MRTGARARKQKYISIYISLYMKTFLKTGVYIYIYIKHGWTALDIVGAGSSKFKGIQGRFYLLYPFRLNGESAREHQGALILRL